MKEFILIFLNYFFFIFHTIFTLFNIFGWIFKKTRIIHLITIILTALSWYVLGIWYGWGYCFCTDWHFQVREKLGYIDPSSSYIHFLILKISGINFNENLIIIITFLVFIICFVLSVFLNILDLIKYKFNFKNGTKYKL